MSTTRIWFNQILKHVLPPACVFCGEIADSYHQCCADCLTHIRVFPTVVCQFCGVPLPREDQPQCGRCIRKPPSQGRTISLFAYEGPVRDAILAWKLSGKEQGVRWLLRSAAPVLQSMLKKNDVLLPVPMPVSRMRKTGQHHTANLARWMAEAKHSAWDWEMLERRKDIPRQSSLRGAARRKNIRGAFSLCTDSGKLLKARRVWVIDDIITTGATVNEAARTVKNSGADVSVLTLSRVIPD